jgi:hypothetical protein
MIKCAIGQSTTSLESEEHSYYFSLFLDDKVYQIISDFVNKHRENNKTKMKIDQRGHHKKWITNPLFKRSISIKLCASDFKINSISI